MVQVSSNSWVALTLFEELFRTKLDIWLEGEAEQVELLLDEDMAWDSWLPFWLAFELEDWFWAKKLSVENELECVMIGMLADLSTDDMNELLWCSFEWWWLWAFPFVLLFSAVNVIKTLLLLLVLWVTVDMLEK